jgi:dihydrolipoamide dehydrogenase
MTAWADHLGAPQVVFTDPEVASAGLTEAAARSEGRLVRVVDVDLAMVSGAGLQSDDFTGAARMVVDAETRVVLGATFVGQDVAEMAHAAAVAVTGRLTVDALWHAIPSFPTMSEAWLRLLEEYGL